MPRVLPVEDADPPRLCDEAKSSRSPAGVSGSKQYGERDAPVCGVREEGEKPRSASTVQTKPLYTARTKPQPACSGCGRRSGGQRPCYCVNFTLLLLYYLCSGCGRRSGGQRPCYCVNFTLLLRYCYFTTALLPVFGVREEKRRSESMSRSGVRRSSFDEHNSELSSKCIREHT
jgi:hypothetical protein